MSYTFRPASTADIPHLVQQRELMFREMGVECDYPAMATACARWFDRAVPDGTFRGWMIAHEREGVVGGGGLIVLPWTPGPYRLDPRLGFVFNVYVNPPHRRQGLAERLMETMHAWCREQGLERIALNSSAGGRSIYERMGYVVAAEPMMRFDLGQHR
jgi:GNAT superfamily N-acetyltransferase